MHQNKAYILNYGVDLMNKNEALDFVTKKIIENQSAQIITINPEMIEMAKKNEKLSEILKDADLIIPESFGIKLALKLRGIQQEQIAGIEFARELINICAENNFPIAFIGAKNEVLTKAVENIKKQTPNLNVVFMQDGYYSNEETVINSVIDAKPRVLLVALGVPKQEFLIKKIKEKNNSIISIGIGGSFDVWAGYVQRAPVIWQKLGLEWFYRTIKQPQRFKRIFPNRCRIDILPIYIIGLLF